MLESKRLLVVDDDENSRRLLELQLRSQGATVTTTGSPIAALQLLLSAATEKSGFDLAVVDYRMPIMDGTMLARAVLAQEAFRDFPIILLASALDQDQLTDLDGLKIAGCLAKPVQSSTLVETIIDALSSGQSVYPESQVGFPWVPPPKAKILVADDNPVTQIMLGLALRRLGFEVDLAGNGKEAVNAFQRGHHDAIVMDCEMAEMGGIEAAREIRRIEGPTRGAVILALSASVDVGKREECLNAGMDDYLSKPVRLEVLAEKLEKWLLRDVSSVNDTHKEIHESITQEVQAHVDYLLQTLDRKNIAELVGSFTSTTLPLIDSLTEAIRNNDAQTALRIAHTLRGSLGSLGLNRLEASVRRLEELVRANRPNTDLLAEIEIHLRIGIDVVRSQVPRA